MYIFNQGCLKKCEKVITDSVNLFQDFDKDPFGSSSDPFGDKKDPFADKGDPFGSADKGADVFAPPEEKKDPFGASDSDPFGETKSTPADPFAQKAQVRLSARIFFEYCDGFYLFLCKYKYTKLAKISADLSKRTSYF